MTSLLTQHLQYFMQQSNKAEHLLQPQHLQTPGISCSLRQSVVDHTVLMLLAQTSGTNATV